MLTCITFMFLRADLQSGRTEHAFFFSFNFSAVLVFLHCIHSRGKGLKVNFCFIALVALVLFSCASACVCAAVR